MGLMRVPDGMGPGSQQRPTPPLSFMASTRTKRHRHVVGLDIEPGYVAAAEVRHTGPFAVERAVSAPLDPGVMRDGEVTDPESLTETLRALWAEHKLPKRVRLGLANQR